MGQWVVRSLGGKPQRDADWGDQKAFWLAPAAAGPLVASLKMNEERWVFAAAPGLAETQPNSRFFLITDQVAELLC